MFITDKVKLAARVCALRWQPTAKPYIHRCSLPQKEFLTLGMACVISFHQVGKMDSEAETSEERLKSFLYQLKKESGILYRIVYENKNQHRGCPYFKFLQEVSSDSRLLQFAHLEEILSSSFRVIHGTRPKQKMQLLESLTRRKCDGGKYNCLERHAYFHSSFYVWQCMVVNPSASSWQK